MQEVFSIIIVVIAMFAGLWVLGWSYGDFEKPKSSSEPKKPS